MFPLKIKLNDDRSFQVRSREAVDTQAGHGTYVIGELAACEQFGDSEYTSSVGMSFRRDEVPSDLRRDKKLRVNKERDARETAVREAAAKATASD